MSRLGVATITPWPRPLAPPSSRGLANLLGDPGYRQQASTVATLLRQERGLDNAADAIEKALS